MRIKCLLVVAIAALLLPACALETDCPQCEERCWEGERQCRECRHRHGCPFEATPEPDEADAPLG
jgi:outer membrane biogenesis lipoprotein LolB